MSRSSNAFLRQTPHTAVSCGLIVAAVMHVFPSGRQIIAQFLGSLQCAPDLRKFQCASNDLSDRFVMDPSSLETALMTGAHVRFDYWYCTLLRLSFRDDQILHQTMGRMLARVSSVPVLMKVVRAVSGGMISFDSWI